MKLILEESKKTIDFIIFQPEKSFYYLSFKARLDYLKSKIIKANEYAYTLPENTTVIFAAPEYLFKDFSKEKEEKFYSHNLKKTYIDTLQTLAQTTKLIIAPGTICWKKPSKEDGETYYRNTAYLFYGNQRFKCKKSYPHPTCDYDYLTKSEALEIMFDKEKHFKSGEENIPIFEIGGITIGVEICADNLWVNLARKKGKNRKIDVQLILADGLEEASYIAQDELLVAKIERRPTEYQTSFFKIEKTHLTYFSAINKIEDDLLYYSYPDTSTHTHQNKIEETSFTPEPIADKKEVNMPITSIASLQHKVEIKTVYDTHRLFEPNRKEAVLNETNKKESKIEELNKRALEILLEFG